METAIDDANQATWKSFRSMFLDEGFHQQGKNFVKRTIVGATLMDSLEENHVIEGYRSFKAEVRDFSSGLMKPEEIDLAAIGAEGVQALLAAAMDAVPLEYERFFGGKNLSSTYVCQYTEQETYDKIYSSYDFATQSYVERVVEKTRTVSRETRDGIDKDAFDKYVSKTNALDDKKRSAYEQSERVVELKAGEFNAWVGYAPVFKSDADPGKSVDNYLANVRFPGYGETGRLMGMFIQHKMIEGAGEAACEAPFYSRKLWDDRGSWFSAPSIRSLADIALAVAVTCVTGVGALSLPTMLAAAGANLIDDAIFMMADIANGLDAGDALQGFAKKGLVSAASMFAVGNLTQFGGTVVSKTVLKGVEVMSNNVVSSAINSLDFEAMFKGKDFFNEKAFNKGAFGEGAMAGVAAGMAGQFVSGQLGEWNLKSSSGIEFTGVSGAFDIKALENFNSTLGGLASTGVKYAMTGNATVNLLNMGMFTERSNIGLFELSFGKDGVHGAIGMGGTDLNVGKLVSSLNGLAQTARITELKTGNMSDRAALEIIAAFDNTDNPYNHELARRLFDEVASLQIGSGKETIDGKTVEYLGKFNENENGSTIVISEALLGDQTMEEYAKIAAVASHEGSHMMGMNIEALAYGMGHDTYSQLVENLDLEGDKDFSNGMLNAMTIPENWEVNTEDTQYQLPFEYYKNMEKYVFSQITQVFPGLVTVASHDIIGYALNYIINTAKDAVTEPREKFSIEIEGTLPMNEVSEVLNVESAVDVIENMDKIKELIQILRPDDPDKPQSATQMLSEMAFDTSNYLLGLITAIQLNHNDDGRINGFNVSAGPWGAEFIKDGYEITTTVSASFSLPLLPKIEPSYTMTASIVDGPFGTSVRPENQEKIDYLTNMNSLLKPSYGY